MYSKVLLAYDGTACADLALQEATRFAAEGARLAVVTVAERDDPPQDGAATAGHAALSKAQVLLEVVSRRLGEEVDVSLLLVDRNECDGDVAHAILQEAGNTGAELIVMGTHGRHGFRRVELGSVAGQVARESTCPVLLVRGDGPGAFDCLSPVEIYGQWAAGGPVAD